MVQRRQRVAQLHQPTSQATAGRARGYRPPSSSRTRSTARCPARSRQRTVMLTKPPATAGSRFPNSYVLRSSLERGKPSIFAASSESSSTPAWPFHDIDARRMFKCEATEGVTAGRGRPHRQPRLPPLRRERLHIADIQTGSDPLGRWHRDPGLGAAPRKDARGRLWPGERGSRDPASRKPANHPLRIAESQRPPPDASLSRRHARRRTLARVGCSPHWGQAPDRGEFASRHSNYAQPLVINRGRRIMQGLLEILWLEKRILGKDRSPVRVGRKKFQYATNCDPHAAYTRLAAALPRFNRYPIKKIYGGDEPSLEHHCTFRWHPWPGA